MTRERIDGWCERGIFALVACILVFGPLAYGAVWPDHFGVIEGMTAGAAALWVVRMWLNPRHPVLWPPIAWAVLAFMAYAGARYAQADVEYVARDEVLKVLTYGVLFLVISTNLCHQRYERALVVVLMVLAACIASYAVYQYVTQRPLVWGEVRPGNYEGRGSGTYINPNHLAGFLEMLLPVGLAFTLAGRVSPHTRIVLGYASIVALAGIGVSISRGGWLATASSLVLFCLLLLQLGVHRAVAMVVLALMLVGATVFVARSETTQTRFNAAIRGGHLEDIRFQLWTPAEKIWREYPWFGGGPGHFDIHFRRHRPATVQMRPERVHNDYLNTLADWGLVGAALVAVPWVLALVGLMQGWEKLCRSQVDFSNVQSTRLSLAVGGMAGLAAILLHSAVDFNMHIPANAIVAVTLLALLTGLWRHTSDRFFVRPRGAVRLVFTLALLGAAAVLAWQGARMYRETHLLLQARGLPPGQQVAVLEAALAVEPMNPETALKLGEAWRLQSWEGETGYEQLAEKAMHWHRRAVELNPWDPYAPLALGMTLDWVNRMDEGETWILKAQSLDPNSFHVLAYCGWHFVQKGDYATAKLWLERSLKTQPWDNPVASNYMAIVKERLNDTQPKQE